MIALQRPAAVIFDMDGLIFDTERLYEAAFHEEIIARGLNQLSVHTSRAMVGLPLPAVRLELARLIGNSKEADLLLDAWSARYAVLAKTDLRLLPGVSELLDLLDRLDIPRAVCTSTGRETAQQHLSQHALLHRFNAIISADDCIEGKPHPEPYIKAANTTSTAPNMCWALEDSPNGVRSAHAAGLVPIMVPDRIQPTEEIGRLCAAVMPSLSSVAECLAELS